MQKILQTSAIDFLNTKIFVAQNEVFKNRCKRRLFQTYFVCEKSLLFEDDAKFEETANGNQMCTKKRCKGDRAMVSHLRVYCCIIDKFEEL